ncbi:MAG: hypothetical protein LUC34_07335 [Campylobacter sp.]|nr:hypothetical protein [Campylobacter sp.]
MTSAELKKAFETRLREFLTQKFKERKEIRVLKNRLDVKCDNGSGQIALEPMRYGEYALHESAADERVF